MEFGIESMLTASLAMPDYRSLVSRDWLALFFVHELINKNVGPPDSFLIFFPTQRNNDAEF